MFLASHNNDCVVFLHSNFDDINGVGVLSVVVIVIDNDEGVTVRKIVIRFNNSAS